MCVCELERVVLKLQLKTHKQMVVDIIFLRSSFFSDSFGVAANHTSHSHITSVTTVRSRDLKDKLMSLDPLVSFVFPFREVEAVAQRG